MKRTTWWSLRRWTNGQCWWAFAVLLFAGSAHAQSGSELRLGVLQVSSAEGTASAVSLGFLGVELERRTSIRADHRAAQVPLDAQRLMDFPLLVLATRSMLPELTAKQVGILSSWMSVGGMLLVDWQGGGGEIERFRVALESWVHALFPGATLVRIPKASVLYRSFYRVAEATGRLHLVEDLFGVQIGERWVMVVSFNDMLSTVHRRSDGRFSQDVLPGGEAQREQAIRLMVNLVVYALCLDYKDDRLHLDYLKSRRKWRLPDPTSP